MANTEATTKATATKAVRVAEGEVRRLAWLADAAGDTTTHDALMALGAMLHNVAETVTAVTPPADWAVGR